MLSDINPEVERAETDAQPARKPRYNVLRSFSQRLWVWTKNNKAVAVSVLSFAIAFLSFITAFSSYYEIKRNNRWNQENVQRQNQRLDDSDRLQNERWEALNKPRLEVSSGEFYVFRELTEAEIDTLNWAPGYKPTIHPIFEGARFSGKYGVYSEVTFDDPSTGKPAITTRLMQTKADVEKEAGRFGLSFPKLYKRYRVRFKVRNLRQLPATNLVLKHAVIMASGEIDKEGARQIEVGSSIARETEILNESVFGFDFINPADASLNPYIMFRIWLEYDYNGQRIKTREQWIRYQPDTNRWSEFY